MVFVFGILSVCTYEYHYKDHLGNLRVAFQAQEDQERERFSLTMEADSSQKEEAEFLNVAAARSDLKDKEGHYSAALENSKQAISKTIEVKKGDKIKASVFATHDPAIAETDPTKVLEEAKKDVLLSLGGVVAGSITTNPTQQEIEIPLNPKISPAQTIITKSPKVQLNLLDFIPVIRNLRELNRAKNAKDLEPDTYFVPKGELVLELRDSTDSLIFEKREKLTISSAVSWEKLVSDLEIKEDGNLKVYIDNSSSDKVYFDEFIIERTEATVAVVVQENHYYPFGMNMKGIEELDIQSLDGKDEHRWQFNGVEKNESFDLNWNETFYRTYDMQLGRWNQIDPLANKFMSWSSYHGMGNNPIYIADPYGDDWYVSNETGNDERIWFDDEAAATKHFGEGGFINLGTEALDEVTVTAESESSFSIYALERSINNAGQNLGREIENIFGDGQNLQDEAQFIAELNPLITGANVVTGLNNNENIFGEEQSDKETLVQLLSIVPANKLLKLTKFSKYLNKIPGANTLINKGYYNATIRKNKLITQGIDYLIKNTTDPKKIRLLQEVKRELIQVDLVTAGTEVLNTATGMDDATMEPPKNVAGALGLILKIFTQ